MSFLKKHQLAVSAACLLFFFIISRLPFFLYFPIPGGFVSDAFEYFMVALEIKRGQLPLFDVRTPGYPLFLFLTDALFGSLYALLVIQNCITLCSSLFLTYAVHKIYPRYTYPVAASMLFYFMSNNSIEADSNVLTNSLYTNLLIVFLGVFMIALRRNKLWGLLSALVALIILVRPSGLFLVPIIGVILLFLFLSARYGNAWVKMLLPATALLVVLCSYNFFTLGKFSISPWGGMNLAGTTITFMETDSSFIPCENAAIRETMKGISPENLSVFQEKFDLEKYHQSYFDNYYLIIPLYKNLLQLCGYADYVQALPSLKKISTTAIREHPQQYATFVLTNLYAYIVDGNLKEHQLFYYSEVPRRHEHIYVKQKQLKPQFFSFFMPDEIPEELKRYGYKEYYTVPRDANFSDKYRALKEHWAFKLYDVYTLKINRIFLRNWFWPIALLLLFFWSGFQLLTSRLTDRHALLIFVICCFNICSAIVVSLVEVSFYHYTYLTEFTYYLAVTLSPILLKK